MLITAEAFRKICPRLNIQHINQLVPLFNSICPTYGIDTADIMHEFFANLCEESMEFTRYEENLNYSADALIRTFGRHRINASDAYRLGRTKDHPANQKELANRLYGGRWGAINLGNTQPGDGFTFRGSGMIQLTGRGNITRFANYMSKQFKINRSPEQWADLLRSNDMFSLHSACWIFAIAKQLIDEAERDQMITIIKRINGGLNGLSSRLRYYELAKKYIV